VRELEHVIQRALVDSGSLSDSHRIRELLEGSPERTGEGETPLGIGDDLTLRELEKRHIEAVLRRCGGNRTRAAEILGIERKSLYRKANRLGITLDGEEDQP
jgi:DNA-binding NtrC family response regulator